MNLPDVIYCTRKSVSFSQGMQVVDCQKIKQTANLNYYYFRPEVLLGKHQLLHGFGLSLLTAFVLHLFSRPELPITKGVGYTCSSVKGSMTQPKLHACCKYWEQKNQERHSLDESESYHSLGFLFSKSLIQRVFILRLPCADLCARPWDYRNERLPPLLRTS